MSKKLHFQLFGYPEIWLDHEKLQFSFSKVNALLYYLVLSKEATRDEIAGLLWPEKSDKMAKKNLRNTIYQANRAIGEDVIQTPNNKRLVLNQTLAITSDVDEFMSQTRDALHLYKDSLMKGFFVKDAEDYDMWVLKMRQFYEKVFVETCAAVIRDNMDNERFEDIEKHIQRLIDIDEFDEKHYQLLMLYYQKTKRSTKVIEVYYQLKTLLDRELGVLPSQETREIYEATLQSVDKKNRIQDKQQAVFFARYKELETIESIVNRLFQDEPTTHVIVQGRSGMGKSSICRIVLENVQHEHLLCRVTCHKQEQSYYLRVFQQLLKQMVDAVSESQHRDTHWDSIYEYVSYWQESTNELPVAFKTLDVIELMISDVLKLLQKQGSIILFFDDIQWLDEQSIQLLQRLMHRFNQENVLFLLTVEPHSNHVLQTFLDDVVYHQLAATIDITAFSKEETARFLKKEVHHMLINNDVIDRVYQETKGVPFYIQEYMTQMNQGHFPDKLTTNMQIFLAKRFNHLTEEQLSVAMLLSCFLKPAPLRVLCACQTDDVLVMETMNLLVQQCICQEDIIDGEVCMTFVQPQSKAFLYGKQTYTQRRLWHQKIAQQLEKYQFIQQSEDMLNELAQQFDLAKKPLESLMYHVQKLELAIQMQYQLFPIYRLDKQVSSKREDKQLLEDMTQLEQKMELLNREFADDDRFSHLRIKFLLLKGCYLIRAGFYEQGIPYIQSVIVQSEARNQEDYLYEAYRQMIYYFIQINNLDNMLIYIEKGLSLLIGLNRYEEVGVFIRLKGLYHLMIGEYAESEKLLEESIRIFSVTTELSNKYASNIAAAYDYLAEINLLTGKAHLALDYHDQAITLSKDEQLVSSRVIFYINKAVTLYYMARYDEAKSVFAIAYTLLPKVAPIWKQVQLDVYDALNALALGDDVKLGEVVARLLEDEKKIASPRDIGLVYFAKVKFLLSQGKTEQDIDVKEAIARAKAHLSTTRDHLELAQLPK